MDFLSYFSINTYKRRIEWIDVARALSIMIIIYAHTYVYAVISHFVHLFHVPVFFFLSGLVWREKGKPLGRSICDAAKSLLIPYYTLAVISIMLYLALGRFVPSKSETLSLWQCILGGIYANSRTGLMAWNRPLWFLPLLFSVRTTWEIIVHYVKNKNIRAGIVGIIFTAGIVMSYIFPGIILPYELEISFVMLGYFFFGTQSRRTVERAAEIKKPWLVLLTAACMGICFIVFHFNGTVTVQYNLYGNFALFIIGSVAGIAMVIFLSMAIKSVSLLQFVGQNTLPVLLWHKFPVLLYQISPIGKRCLNAPDSIKSICLGLLVVILTVIICLAIAYLIKKIRDKFDRNEFH